MNTVWFQSHTGKDKEVENWRSKRNLPEERNRGRKKTQAAMRQRSEEDRWRGHPRQSTGLRQRHGDVGQHWGLAKLLI